MVYGVVMPSDEIYLDNFENIDTPDAYIAVIHEFIHERNDLCDFLLVQDNARFHTPKKTIGYFNEEEVYLLPWAPFSHDLNIIEYVWYMLSIMVHESS